MYARSVVWLASYPRSGNTWFRLVLNTLLEGDSGRLDINRTPHADLIASSRRLFDDWSGISASDLTQAEIETYRRTVYLTMARSAPAPVFVKVHDAYNRTPQGSFTFPPEITRSTLYFVRNPLDVCVSFAAYFGVGIDEAIARMADRHFALSENSAGLSVQLRQRLSDWSGHVQSWCDAAGMNVHVVRYEDMLKEPFATFKATLQVAGLQIADGALERAVELCSFAALQEQEQRLGFRERRHEAGRFFVHGSSGAGKALITAEQVARIRADHAAVMARFGYS